jgi:quercetin dioxygenase-like cupin family protein
MNHIDLQKFQADPAALPRSTALFREPGLRGLLLHLKQGEEIPEHSTPGAITVHCLKGEVIFTAADERTSLVPGRLISLASAVPHRLTAQQDSLLLVTIREEIRNQAA